MSDPDLGVENALMIVHGEHGFTYHRPVRPGDVLTMTPRLDSVEDKGSGATFTSSLSAVDADGAPVVDQWATIFVRGGGSGRERPRGERPPPPIRGEEAAVFASHVAQDMPTRYAAASGDHNPIHLDPAVAAAVGLPGVINHGLGTLSLVCAGIVEHVLGGDPTVVSELRTRFTDMVFPGSDLATTVWERGDGPGYLFETTRPDGAVVMSGSFAVAEA